MDNMVLADFLADKHGKKKLQSVTGKEVGGKSKTQHVAAEDDLNKEENGKVGGYDVKTEGKNPMVDRSNSRHSVSVIKQENLAEENMTIKVETEGSCKTPTKRKHGADSKIMEAFLTTPNKSLSRLRPRKEVPTFRKIELNDSDSERIVGKKIKVYWPGSKRWFLGCIKSFDNASNLHKIHYEDGDKEDLNLKHELFEVELMPSESFTLKTEVKKNVKGGSSGSRARKGTEAKKDGLVLKMDVDVHPGLGDANSGKDSGESKSFSEMAAGARGSGKVLAGKQESESEIKNLDYEGSKVGKKTVKGGSVEAGDAKGLRRDVDLDKEVKRKTIKIKLSKSQSAKESEEGQNSAADMNVVVNCDEMKTQVTHGETSIEKSPDVMNVNVERDGGQSYKKRAGRSNFSSKKHNSEEWKAREEMRKNAQKSTKLETKLAPKDATQNREDDMVNLAGDVELSVHAGKSEGSVMSLKLNVEGPHEGHAAKSNEIKSLVEAVSDRTDKVPPVFLRKQKVENSENAGCLAKPSSEGATKTSACGSLQVADNSVAGDILKDLAGQKMVASTVVGKKNYAESWKKQVKRKA